MLLRSLRTRREQQDRDNEEMGNFTRLMGYLAKYWHLVFLSMFAVVAATGLNLVSPLIVREVVDRVLVEKEYSTLPLLTLAIVGVSALRGVFRFVQRYVQSYVGQRVVFDIRTDLFQAFQEKSFSFYDRRRTGQLMSRATSDVERVRVLQSWWIANITSSALTTVSITAILISLDLRLTLLSATVFPPIFICAYFLSKKIRPKHRAMRELMGAMTSILQENIVGTRVARAFAREDFEMEKFGEKNTEYLETQLETVRLRATYGPLMNLMLSLGIVLVYWYGGGEAIKGELSIGTLVAFAAYLSMLANPVRFLGFLITFYNSAMTGADRIFEILDYQTEVKQKPAATNLPSLKGEVKMEHVYFGYDPNRPIIEDLNLTVEPGETIALLGATGSGKSTVTHLIPRFYDVVSGRVLVDGNDVRDVTLKSLRDQIGIVPQETFLFSTTIRENIAFGKPNATVDEIIEAAKMAKAHDFIMSFPDGYETIVGERGATLSGGQKQRIALARALLRRPRILIMDDSTSSVDVDTEQEIQEAIQNVLKERTAFIITQRLSTIKDADRIVVLEDGKISEEGTHEELLAKGGIYTKIYETQFDEESYFKAEKNSRKAHSTEA